MNDFFTLLLPWQEAPKDQISDIFVYIILFSFLVALGYFVLITTIRVRLISDLVNQVSQHTKPAKPEILPRLKTAFDCNSELAEVWQEFEDSLITRPAKESQKKIVYKTDEASLFFSEERLLGQYMNLRFWNSVPALLVGLGILGTFVGLVGGLTPFSGINFKETEDIRSAIEGLLSGVSTAFVTSVWGMFLSLLFNWIEKLRIGRVARKIAALQRVLDQLFTLTTQEEIAFRQEDELAQQTQALKAFSTDLANEIKSAMARGRQEIIAEFRNAPEAFGNAIAEKFAPSFDNLNAAVRELQRQKEESSTNAIQQLVEEFQRSLSGSATAQMEALAETVNKASESLIALPKKLADMMRGVQEQVDQAQRLLSKTSDDQTEQMKGMMEQMSKAFQNAIDTHQTGLSETTDSINQVIKKSTTRLDNIFKSGESSVSLLLKQQENQIKKVNAQVANSRETLEKSSEMLQQMDASVSNVQDLLKDIRVLSNLLIRNGNKLEDASERLIEVSKTFTEANTKYLTANRETTQQLQKTLVQSRQLLNDFAQRFQTINTGLTDIFKEIEGGLTNYSTTTRDSINTYLSGFSEHLTQASEALAGGVEALTESVHELTDMAENLTNRRGLR